eukprot:Transcript_20472.p1 GENE.Transcript_20472~~Transcript_20472.p1  ORF type:complete len:100 (-),score=6.28 Transcript_20472:86-385(-)
MADTTWPAPWIQPTKPWTGHGRALFELADARKIVLEREQRSNERFARALANAPRLGDVIPRVDDVDSAWHEVQTKLSAPTWNPELRLPPTCSPVVIRRC